MCICVYVICVYVICVYVIPNFCPSTKAPNSFLPMSDLEAKCSMWSFSVGSVQAADNVTKAAFFGTPMRSSLYPNSSPRLDTELLPTKLVSFDTSTSGCAVLRTFSNTSTAYGGLGQIRPTESPGEYSIPEPSRDSSMCMTFRVEPHTVRPAYSAAVFLLLLDVSQRAPRIFASKGREAFHPPSGHISSPKNNIGV
jgi:hypothetical protein